jgi:hypothetical protein
MYMDRERESFASGSSAEPIATSDAAASALDFAIVVDGRAVLHRRNLMREAHARAKAGRISNPARSYAWHLAFALRCVHGRARNERASLFCRLLDERRSATAQALRLQLDILEAKDCFDERDYAELRRLCSELRHAA